MAVVDRLLAPDSLFSRRFFFLAKRFVAGETIASALEAVRGLNAQGMSASLDFLGEDVREPAEAQRTRDVYVELLAALSREGLNSNVSVKLTALGLLIDEDLAVRHLTDIVTAASSLRDPFVRIDMEGSNLTDATIRVFERVYFGHPNVGLVLQAYLHRTPADVDRAIEFKARVRLCKGAYNEPASIAYKDMPTIRRHYLRLAEALLSRGNYPAIATHDEHLIRAVRAYAEAQSITSERFEFQMLYGVRPQAQDLLVRDGYRMRVYVPFGTHWAGYFYRRIVERKENALFALGSMIRR